MTEESFLTKLKTRWGITSNLQVLVIFFVFGITGSSAVWVGAPVLNYLGIHKTMSPWAYWPMRILVIFPIYQILLIIYGSICGQFRFFWNFEKKMFGRFTGGSSKKVKA